MFGGVSGGGANVKSSKILGPPPADREPSDDVPEVEEFALRLIGTDVGASGVTGWC